MTIMPPPQYDYPPSVPVIEHVMTFAELQAWCVVRAGITMPPNMASFGCAVSYGPGKVCNVYMMRPEAYRTRQAYEDTRRHELAHCNGWPADHPLAPGRVVPKVTLEKTTGGTVKPWPGEQANE